MKTAATKRRNGWWILAMLLLCPPLSAEEHDAFVVKHADFNLDQTLLQLDMVVDSRIPKYILLAIDQGFAVPMMFEVEILLPKKFWIDTRVVSLKQRYLLQHQPMLDSFVVLDVNSSERRYFDDRDAAVEFIEVVYNYPMLDINNLAPDRNYYARLRFGIDSDELPLPLKSSSLWDNDWDLKSDWYEWEVRRPGS
ncbi:MAG TPA: DUF4390 domain-containing protein [Gammaproteobacteria bacterium]|nr:DUF4390 domain-containing protein [Gammaproteobacteria bacterium]